ncbi:MAG: heparin lyase I family protein, partial [Paraglaciecola sp.]|uniref:heparin lyase I family protein n=1 Tax=Paraglaciecola sp. TaxID=1920173 RepID=UPI003296EC6E
IFTTNGEWMIDNKWDSKVNTFESGDKVYDGDEQWNLGEYETGSWINWVFQVKWSHKEDGLINVWKDGELVVSKTGANTFNDKTAPYFKAGIYKGWHDSSVLDENNATNRTIYFDDVAIKTDSSSSSAIATLQ